MVLGPTTITLATSGDVQRIINAELLLDQFTINNTVNTMVGNKCWLTGLHGKFMYSLKMGTQALSETITGGMENYYTRIMLVTNKKGTNVQSVSAFLNGTGTSFPLNYSQVHDIFIYPGTNASATQNFGGYEMIKILKDKWYAHKYSVQNIIYGQGANNDPVDNIQLQDFTNTNIKFKWAIRKRKLLEFARDQGSSSTYVNIPMNKNYWIVIFTNLPNNFVYQRSGYRIHTYKDP